MRFGGLVSLHLGFMHGDYWMGPTRMSKDNLNLMGYSKPQRQFSF